MTFDFTICIITFNRGERTLKLVNTLLEELPEKWCVMVLDNTSTRGVEYYQEIKNISTINEQVSYIRHEINGHFHGNYLSCFKHVKSKYFTILSDEDFIDFSELELLLNEIKLEKNLGVCRPSIKQHKDLDRPLNSVNFGDSFSLAGEEAMKNFCFTTNYISGIIYNLELINSYNLIPILEKNLEKNATYPHLYFDLLISAKCDVRFSSRATVLEGLPEKSLDERGIENTYFEHVGGYGIGARINQFLVLRDGILDAVKLLNKEEKDEFIIFLQIYLLLVQKYFYLIGTCNMPSYKRNHIEESLLLESFFYITTSAVFAYPQVEPYKDVILEGITSVYNHYKQEIN
jgi:hypothetical protein